MKNRIFIVLTLLFIGDIVLSFFQHIHFSLDGDMAAIIFPDKWYATVLKDPFGFAIFKGETYAGAGRFFSHFIMEIYFKTMPFFLQNFTNPIDSIYASNAIFKIFIKVSLIAVLANYVVCSIQNRTNNSKALQYLMAFCLLFPLFQIKGFYSQIGIIDRSITYVFFYALPLLLVLIWWLPFYKTYLVNTNKTFNTVNWLWLLPLLIVFSFSGPIIQPTIILVCGLCLAYSYIQSYKTTNSIFKAFLKIPKPLLAGFSLAIIISLYAFYVGRFNAENASGTLSLAVKYKKLAKGLLIVFFKKPGLPLLIGFIVLNFYLLRRFKIKAEVLKKLTLLIVVFSIIYLLLLPFGGYRHYRPHIIRYDTFMPISVGVILVFTLGVTILLSELKRSTIKRYLLAVVGLLVIFQLSDIWPGKSNVCEKQMLQEIVEAKSSPHQLSKDCKVLTWEKFQNPEYNRTKSEMIKFWGITDDLILYYYK